MRRLLLHAALVMMMASAAVAHADTFTFTFDLGLQQTLTFYLAPELYPLGMYGVGSTPATTLSLDGNEYDAQLIFFSPENSSNGIGWLQFDTAALPGPARAASAASPGSTRMTL
jgi:hypothetical protein